jgi:ssDNA-binding Zn-finger/Zn-ribbon topoisomerase 1
MTVLYPIRKACPACGKPMKVVPGNQTGGERYLCTGCEDDSLHDPAVRKWTDSPLKPPAK